MEKDFTVASGLNKSETDRSCVILNFTFRPLISILVLLLFILPLGCGKRPANDDSGQMVLRNVMFVKLKGFDPAHAEDVYCKKVIGQIFENLYDYHYLKRPYEIIPLLADGLPQISDDKLTYTIKIKKGIYYQDDNCFPEGKGRELKASDFVYAYKRLANIKTVSPRWSFIDGKIAGLDQFREYTKTVKKGEVDYTRQVEGLKALDDHTLQFKLTKPYPQFISSTLTDASYTPIAVEAVKYYGKDIISNPVGTGPFRLSQWRRGSFVELVRNPNFREEFYPTEGEESDKENGYLDDTGKKIPFADKITWTIIEEKQPRWLLLMQGKLDWIENIPKDNYGEAISVTGGLTKAMKDRNIRLKIYPEPSLFWLGFNMEDPVLGSNKPLRRAISYAFDREKFVELFKNNRDIIAHGIIAPVMVSYNREIKQKGFAKFDPDKARQLLKEAEKNYGSKLPVLKIAVPGTDTTYRQIGQFFEKCFNEVGLLVEIDYMDWPTYQQRMNKKQLQIFFSGCKIGIPDAIDFLVSFYSKNASPGPNSYNYFNPEFDRLYEVVEVMEDCPQRTKLYRQMEQIVLEDCPAAFINHRISYALYHDWYKNYKPHVFSYNLNKYYKVDLEKRNAYKDLLKEIK